MNVRICGTSPKLAPDTQAGFAGYKWQVVDIGRAGKETLVARYAVSLMFAPDGQFAAIEPVNDHGGLYHQTSDGFTTSQMVQTWPAYVGHDPVPLLAIDAISAFHDGVHAKVQLTGNRLAVTVGGYLLICQRDGRQANLGRDAERSKQVGQARKRSADDSNGDSNSISQRLTAATGGSALCSLDQGQHGVCPA